MSYKDKEFESQTLKNHTERAIKLLQLAYPRYVTRAEMAEWLDMGDRNMRAVMSYAKQNYPILSMSKVKGYKLVCCPEKDMEELIHCWCEIDSRIHELELQREQLKKVYDKKYAITEEQQIKIFYDKCEEESRRDYND